MNSGIDDPSSDIVIRPLALDELDNVVAIHMKAYPNAALTRLGPDFVRRYYLWRHRTADHFVLLGAWSGARLVGFEFAGSFREPTASFVRQNWPSILHRIARKPRVLLAGGFVARTLVGARMIAPWLRRRRASKSVAPADRQPRFRSLSLAIDPAFQGRGIGTALLIELEQVARSMSLKEIGATNDVDNIPIIRIHERLNWERIGTEPVWRGAWRKVLE